MVSLALFTFIRSFVNPSGYRLMYVKGRQRESSIAFHMDENSKIEGHKRLIDGDRYMRELGQNCRL